MPMPGAWQGAREATILGTAPRGEGFRLRMEQPLGKKQTTSGKPALTSSWRDSRPMVEGLRVTIAPVKLKLSPIPN